MKKIKMTKKHAFTFIFTLFTIIWVAYISPANLNFLHTNTEYFQVLEPNQQKLIIHTQDYSPSFLSNNMFSIPFLELSRKITTSFYVDNDIEEITPTEISNDNQGSFWTIDLFGKGKLGKGNSGEEHYLVKKGLSSFRVNITTDGENGFWRLIHDYGLETEEDWSDAEHLAFWWYGGGSGLTGEIRIEATSDSGFMAWYFLDNYTGWKRHVFHLNSPHFSTVDDLQVALGNVRFVSIGYLTIDGVWYLDRVLLDVGLSVKIQFDVSQLTKTVKEVALYSFNPKNSDAGKFEGPAAKYDFDTNKYSNTSFHLFFLDGSTSSQVFGDFSSKLIESASSKVIILNLKIPPHDGLETERGSDSHKSGCSQILIKVEFEKKLSNWYPLDVFIDPYYLILMSSTLVSALSFYLAFLRPYWRPELIRD